MTFHSSVSLSIGLKTVFWFQLYLSLDFSAHWVIVLMTRSQVFNQAAEVTDFLKSNKCSISFKAHFLWSYLHIYLCESIFWTPDITRNHDIIWWHDITRNHFFLPLWNPRILVPELDCFNPVYFFFVFILRNSGYRGGLFSGRKRETLLWFCGFPDDFVRKCDQIFILVYRSHSFILQNVGGGEPVAWLPNCVDESCTWFRRKLGSFLCYKLCFLGLCPVASTSPWASRSDDSGRWRPGQMGRSFLSLGLGAEVAATDKCTGKMRRLWLVMVIWAYLNHTQRCKNQGLELFYYPSLV